MALSELAGTSVLGSSALFSRRRKWPRHRRRHPTPLVPAVELAAKNTISFPNESAEYRRARNALLAEEIELRRHIERVAEMRRALPPGGEVKKNYQFQSERGPVTFADLVRR